MEKLFLIVIGHTIGDYVLQTNYIASQKGKDYYIMFVHCILYLIPFYIFFGFNWLLTIIFITHFIADTLKARYNKTNIVIDQIIHYIVLTLYFI